MVAKNRPAASRLAAARRAVLANTSTELGAAPHAERTLDRTFDRTFDGTFDGTTEGGALRDDHIANTLEVTATP